MPDILSQDEIDALLTTTGFEDDINMCVAPETPMFKVRHIFENKGGVDSMVRQIEIEDADNGWVVRVSGHKPTIVTHIEGLPSLFWCIAEKLDVLPSEGRLLVSAEIDATDNNHARFFDFVKERTPDGEPVKISIQRR